MIATVFSLFDLPSEKEVQRAVERGLGFVERDAGFRSTILDHPSQTSSGHDVPHTLPEEWGAALFELGRFFGQALYYHLLKRIMTPDQLLGVAMFTNAASQDEKKIARAFGESLTWFVPEPADKKQDALFGFGAAYDQEASTLYFSAERRESFVWFGVAGSIDPKLLGLEDAHIWRGDGTRVRNVSP